MAKLILRRLHQWPDIRQSYEIHLDGTPVASIGSGKTVEIEGARSPRDHGDDGPVLEQPTGPTRHRPGRGSSRRGRDVLEESHWEPEGRLVGRPVNPTWWESTMARLGPDHFGRVVWVGFNGSPIGEPDDGVMAHIARLEDLEELDFGPVTLSSGGISDDGLAHLSGLKLRQLRLESPWISGAGLRHVGGMTDLGCLVLNSPRLDSPLPLGHLTELRWVGLDGGGGRRHGDPGTIERALPSRIIAYPGWRRWLGLPQGPLKARTSQFVRHLRHRYGPGLTGPLEQLLVSLSAGDRSHRRWHRTTLDQVSCNSSLLSPDGRKAWIIVGPDGWAGED